MKNLLFLLIPCAILISCNMKKGQNHSPSDFKIIKGTNIAHWLSQSDARGVDRETFFTEEDVALIKNLGFDHIRLPIDEEQMWDETGARHAEAFTLMTNCLGWCKKYDLKVIVDLHILRSHHFNAAVKPLWTDPEEQDKFIQLWIDLSSVLKQFPAGDVAYELMNEAVADDPEQWNQLIDRAMKAIRQLEKERIIVIGSNRWQSASTFDDLKVPDDKNIILSYHFYEPFLLTHFNASWTGLKNYTGPVHYPGVILSQEEFDALPADQQELVKDWTGAEWNLEKLEAMMQKPIQKGKELGLQVYCGEYGVIDKAPVEDKIKWYNDMIAIFNKNGVASANWNYKSGSFGFVDKALIQNKPMIEAITKR